MTYPPGDHEQRDERIQRLEAISFLPIDKIIGIRVKDIITEVTEFDRNQLEDDTRLVEDIGFDWDDEVDGEELSMSLEEEFGIGISANELVEMETVLDLINFIKAKKANG
jgi:acyl carrier protein